MSVTRYLSLPLPDPQGVLEEDVLHLIRAFQLLDGHIWTIREVLSADDADLDTVQEIITVLKAAQGQIGSLADILATKADKAEVAALAAGLIRDEVTVETATWSSHKIQTMLEALSRRLTETTEELLASAATLADGKLDRSGGVMTGPILFSQEHDIGSIGTAVTIDWSKAQYQRLTLTATSSTVTFSTPPGVFRGSLKIINSTAAVRAITWPSGVKFLGGIAPQAPENKAGAVAVYAVYWDGAVWYISGGRYA